MSNPELVPVTSLWPRATYNRIAAESKRLKVSPGEYVVNNFLERRPRQASTDPAELIRFFTLLRKALASGDISLIPREPHCIGINRGNRLLLLPPESIQAARATASTEGTPFTATAATLGQLMLARDLLIQTDESTQALRRINGTLRRVWSLPPQAFWLRK